MPAAYTSQQSRAIGEFREFTQVDKSNAVKFLKQHAWNVSAAVNAFLGGTSTASSGATVNALNGIFDRYRDDPKGEPDEINANGTGELLGQLSIELDDVAALIFSELVGSPSLGRITREGFVNGCRTVNIDSTSALQRVVDQRRLNIATDRALFEKVYLHTFQLPLAQGAKTLPLEIAKEFWRILFSRPSYEWKTATTPWLDWWLEFLEEKKVKGVNKDLWKQTRVFAGETVKDESLSFWNEESSWPSTIDEFVEWIKAEKRPAGASAGDAMAMD